MAAHQTPHPWDSPSKNIGVGCHFLLQCMKVKSESEVAQLCPTLRDPMACSLPGSSVKISQSCSNSCPLCQWCYLIISSSASPFSFCLQSFPSSRSFPMSWLFTSGGQNIGVSASTSVLPVNIHSWFLLGLTGLSSLQSKGLSRVFSSPRVQKHQFFRFQPYL